MHALEVLVSHRLHSPDARSNRGCDTPGVGKEWCPTLPMVTIQSVRLGVGIAGVAEVLRQLRVCTSEGGSGLVEGDPQRLGLTMRGRAGGVAAEIVEELLHLARERHRLAQVAQHLTRRIELPAALVQPVLQEIKRPNERLNRVISEPKLSALDNSYKRYILYVSGRGSVLPSLALSAPETEQGNPAGASRPGWAAS